MLKKPLIALNLKTYGESLGENAEKLLEAAEKAASESGKLVIVCPQTTELKHLCSKYEQTDDFRVFAQHFDSFEAGAHTGSVSAEALKACKCTGSLLNHSEKKVGLQEVEKCVKTARQAGIDVIVCADSVEEARNIAPFKPAAIAVEPPELIGRGISVSSAKPEIVTESVKAIRSASPETLALVGAGVSSASDVKKSMGLGADGVLLASAYAKSSEPGKLLEEMLQNL